MKKVLKFIGFGFLGLIALGVIGSIAGGGEDTAPVEPAKVETTAPAPKEEPKKEDTAPAPAKKEEPKKEEPKLSLSQQNAVRQAEQYLSYSAFSKSGLVEQLEFEGYSSEDANFAVNNLTVDWKEQAVLKGQQYLEYSAFSRSGLIEQLVFEGFTNEEATHAVDVIGL